MLNNLESDVPEPLDGRQTLGVRKDPLASSDSHVTVKQPKYKSTSHASSRVRAGDFDNVTQKVLDAAIAEYRVVICTRDPFPDANYNQEISAQAWVNACVVGNIRIQPNEEIMKLITIRASEVRGRLKTMAHCVVPNAYGLSKLNEDEVNRKTIASLLTKNSYLYRDVTTREGCLLTQVIPDIINLMWFKNKKDDGVVFWKYFGTTGDGLPLETLALVCVAIENCLDEYQGGAFKEISFTRSAYKARYVARLTYLQDFATRTKETAIIPRLCQHLLKVGHKHAKADTEPAIQNIVVDDIEVESATKEWENIIFSDEE
ncbi:hypothetical protein BGW80DRAFT_1189143 [Lactifluus volemus]|nr:hypothetical protein BGW80DRAFT_1189143 [Lactifluus volemus]